MPVILLLPIPLLACGARRTDLLPVGGPGPTESTASCTLDGEGNLTVRITNRGSSAAQATTTVVEFDSHWPITLPTRPVTPGQTTELRLPLPDNCRQGCGFRITADALDEIAETDERNNQLSGTCR